MSTWWNRKSKIPYENPRFQSIINSLVFECPSCTRKKEKNKNPDGPVKSMTTYHPVSARSLSFRERNITNGLLTTLSAQIRNPLMHKDAYSLVEQNQSVERAAQRILTSSGMADAMFDLIVFQKRSDMPDTESIFYYIRNAFAHGSFEVLENGGDPVYLLESAKDGVIKAQMRLKEKTLLRYADLAKMTADEIRSLRKANKNRKKGQTKKKEKK